jgi:hypothetical protein
MQRRNGGRGLPLLWRPRQRFTLATANADMLSHLCLARGAAIAIGCALAAQPSAAQPAAAQVTPGAAGAVVTPVEFVMETINGEVRCRPPRARLPARTALEVRVENRAAIPIFFVAPDFFRAANVKESAGFVYDVGKGGFLAAPNSTVRVVLGTPEAGEYYYSCFAPGTVPTPPSSGFLVVVPPARP